MIQDSCFEKLIFVSYMINVYHFLSAMLHIVCEDELADILMTRLCCLTNLPYSLYPKSVKVKQH